MWFSRLGGEKSREGERRQDDKKKKKKRDLRSQINRKKVGKGEKSGR